MVSLKTERFLREQRPPTPFLVVDTDLVEENYQAMRRAMPEAEIFYAIKANPAGPILERLVRLGSSFDCASLPEIEMALRAGAPHERISFGNTIKKESDIFAAYQAGVRIFAFDSLMELEKLARQAPGSRVFCRILTTGHGAIWPLTRKFGCEADMAHDLLLRAKELGLVPWGVSFHVGSQQQNPRGWHDSIKLAAWLFKRLEKKGVELEMVNLGGGFPACYMDALPSLAAYGTAIHASLVQCFGNRLPSTIIIEPGRAMVGNTGVVQTEVVLVAEKSRHDSTRWVFLDCGKFGGLNETDDERLLYPISTDYPAEAPKAPVIIAGPTCDSADILYEKHRYELPLALQAGDRLTFHAAGAYTTTYSTVGFNGFAPLKAYYL